MVVGQQLPQSIVLILSGQPDFLVCFLAFPNAEGSSLIIVDLHWPIKRQSSYFVHCSVFVMVSFFDPENWFCHLRWFQPLSPILIPKLYIAISPIPDKLHELPIRDQHSTCLEFRHIEHFLPKLIIPAIIVSRLDSSSFPFNLASIHSLQFILAYIFLGVINC